jgi:hypothetical protein
MRKRPAKTVLLIEDDPEETRLGPRDAYLRPPLSGIPLTALLR